MITVESKLQLFNKVVLEKIKEEREQILLNIDAKRYDAFELQKKESTEKADMFLKAIIDEAYEDKKAMLARAKSDLKKRVLSQRQTLINNLEEAVLKRFDDFVEDASYTVYIEEAVEKHLEDLKGFGKFSVELSAKHFDRDKAIFQEKLKKLGLEAAVYMESDEALVGGGVFYNETKDVLIDVSLRSLIEEHRKEIGQRMYVMLNEVGEGDVKG